MSELMETVRASSRERPPVSIVVPFKGGDDAARRLLDALDAVELRDGDEVIVVDNTRPATFAAAAAGRRPRVVHAPAEGSSYYARNVGAAEARGEWILFTDADCRPRATILDDYFADAVPDRCGALGGEVVGASEQDSVVARFSRARRVLDQAGHLDASVRRFAGTANLLVRREAWDAVGGFCEGIRTGGDQDFSWRLQDQGWTIEYAGGAVVEHLHRERIGGLLEQSCRYGTAIAWLSRRHPETYRQASVVRSLGGAVKIVAKAGTRLRRREDAVFTALDGLAAGAFALGPLLENRARRTEKPISPRVVELVDAFDTSTAGASTTHVEARRRAERPRAWLARELRTSYAEDDGDLRYAIDAGWLALRHPLRVVRVLRGGASARDLLAFAPTARRLARLLRLGATCEVDAGRRADGTLVAELLDGQVRSRQPAARESSRGRS
jgi:GT2 family glycosyltransferase